VLGRRDEAAGLVQLAEALPAAAPVVAARVDGLREATRRCSRSPPSRRRRRRRRRNSHVDHPGLDQQSGFATMVMIAIRCSASLLQQAGGGTDAGHRLPGGRGVRVVSRRVAGGRETDLTKPIEDAVNPIGGVRQITSRSREGSCVVIIEFELKTDVNVAIQEVRDRIARIRIGFPRDAKEPYISKADTDNEQPIFNLAVTSEQRGLRELTTMAEQVIRKRLENVRGVGSIELSGGTKRQFQILLDPAAMTALGVGVEQVIAALRKENLDMPAGSITRGSEESWSASRPHQGPGRSAGSSWPAVERGASSAVTLGRSRA
jgi:hypothetical protein